VASRAEITDARDEALYGFLDVLDCGRQLNIIGIDEVGRGSLAGPLTVAAVFLPLAPRISGLNDSKQLSAVRRGQLSAEILKTAKSYSIIDIPAEKIDHIGIVKAVVSGMKQALEAVVAQMGAPDIVRIDGRPMGIHPAEQAVIKGDSKAACIAAASIIAKVHRDALMTGYGSDYLDYEWQRNKGYASTAHIATIRELGLTPLHRQSFCQGILQETLF
jgi:ribonuclease HII